MTPNWHHSLVDSKAPVLDAISVVDHAPYKVAVVVDKESKLLGVITDGDVRRGILAGISLDDPVTEIMNARPRAASVNDSAEFCTAVMRSQHIRHLPIIDFDNRVVGLETLGEADLSSDLANPVVLMAGGLGTRLRPLTGASPKPLLPVGERPMLETILLEMASQGFREFFISLQYLGEQIREHFEDGEKFGVRISYLEEREQLGTAGALRLLPTEPQDPVVVANGDVLTKLDFRRLLDYHAQNDACATMCVNEHTLTVPYGVVGVEERRLCSIEEKPDVRHLVNAGIYVLSPEVVSLIPQGERYDMTTLFSRLIAEQRNAVAYPIREYWTDVGRPVDLERAKGTFRQFFE